MHTEVEFWSNVSGPTGEKGCRLWIAGHAKSKYGILSWRGKVRTAHTVAYELQHGPIPPGLEVCHTCDVRDCVRAEHLVLGTTAFNAQDSWAKGRNIFQRHPELRPRGERHPKAKLDWTKVREIRAAIDPDPAELAHRYGVHPDTIKNVLRNKFWKESAL